MRFLAPLVAALCVTTVACAHNETQTARSRSLADERPPLFAEAGLIVHGLVEHQGPIGRPSQLAADISNEELEPYHSWLMPNFMTPEGAILLTEGGHLLQLNGKVILIDTGIGRGAEQSPPDPNALFLVGLRGAGIAPEDVDIVVNTHLHVDHIGWNTFGPGTPTFPNARYKIPRADWDFAQANRSTPLFNTVETKVRPLVDAGLVDFVEGGEVLAAGVRLERWPGHTPGHQAVVVERGDLRVVFAGDILHHPAQVVRPQWDFFAVDREASIASRHRFLETYGDGRSRIVPTHCAGPGWGVVTRNEGGYRFVAGRP